MADAQPEGENITPQSLVTEEHVRKVLLEDKGKDAQLKSWKVVDFTKRGDNYACVVTSVQVKYSINESENNAVYVVKLNPRRGMDIYKEMTNVFFIKESKFYLNLLPELNSVLEAIGEKPLNFPQCFHSSLEMRKEQIYFEDLRKRDFKMFDRKKGMDVPHATLVLRELARLHSASLLLQAKYPEPLEIKHDYLLKDYLTFAYNTKDLMLPMLDANLTHSIQMLEKIGGYERAIAWIESLRPQMEGIMSSELKNNKYDVVCHGDCWNNNVLFRYNSEGDPIEVMLLDLQICRKASPSADLNYFMYTSLVGDVRRPNLSSFLSSYYTSFSKVMDAGGLAMPFSEEELMKEFRAKNKLGGIFGMMFIPVLLMEPDEVPDLSTGDNDFKELMKELREKSMDMLSTNPMMKPRFLATFDELMETGLIP